MEDKPKRKRGRPNLFKERVEPHLEKISELAKKGLTNADIAKAFHVAQGSWFEWKRNYPQLAEALKVGEDFANDLVENALFQSATGYSHPDEEIHVTKHGEVIRVPVVKHYPPNPTSMIFWSKNRRPARWREKVEHEHSGQINQVVQYHKPGRREK